MKKVILLITFGLCISFAQIFACDCGPAYNQDALDEKVYGGANYVFLTAEVLSVQSSFHLEVTIQVNQVFYGAKFIKDITKPLTVYFDLRTECAIIQLDHIKTGNTLFITTVYNAMGRMFMTNNCDAFYPADQLEGYQLNDYLASLKTVE